ncbi:hypothetical protein N7495_006461 [Penicillium taxi]|uniref:uncharacterized protein n=1 Tax=Penicillium taxi TaxID=168475 RepID=UPI00254589D5|nr:uncharacterized protein N7495_006461 [Penicillium taxi]KAJ5894770.1 hypothetical protein N7495_006461 [Penicillium taxi]
MVEPKAVQAAFAAANHFLNPVINRDEIQKSQGKQILEILSQSLEILTENEGPVRTAVICKALDLLSHIHTAFVAPVVSLEDLQQPEVNQDPSLEDARRRRTLHALLDLISLEGIYPSLSSGVGIPLQQRVISVLPAGVIAKQDQMISSTSPHNQDLLHLVMEALLKILEDETPSIQPVIRGRILSDIISGIADLAFNPNVGTCDDRAKLEKSFSKIIDETASAVLLPTLSSFLQSETVAWFKSTISSQISQVPLRSGGVLQTIMFIVSQFTPSLGQEAQSEPSNGPHFTVQAIMQISKLLSSVPQGIEPALYFTTIAPQLLELMDGDDLDLRKTASYAIGNGILGKRSYGAPGTIGHSIFIDPVFGALTAKLNDASRQWITPTSESHESKSGRSEKLNAVLVDGAVVDLAMNRLISLSLQHPNPGLVKRIVYPILIPLWGLACYSQEQQLNSLHNKVMELLKTYFSISAGVQPFKKIIGNLLWDGGLDWTYTIDSKRRISLIARREQGDHSNLIRLIDSLDRRSDIFVQLLGSDPSIEEHTSDMFLYVSQIWLVKPHSSDEKIKILGEQENIIQKLVCAKVAEKLLNNFKDTLSRRPLRVLELIKQVIDGELHEFTARLSKTQAGRSNRPSLSSLSNIVSEESGNNEGISEKDASESLSTAFSLLSTVLASPEFSISQETQKLLESIKNHLDQLIPMLPPLLSKPATTSSMLLEIQLMSSGHDETKPPPPHISDLETHRQALTNLNSDLPPVQAEGFSLLSKLIKNSSPVLDIPSTLTLLLSIINDMSGSSSNDEFIYLNAIKLIGTLASRHPRTVIKTLVESYTDKSEQRSLDQRLKIGESLLRTVQDLGQGLNGETARILGEGMITVAGRRGYKPQAQTDRKKQAEKERMQHEREERENRGPTLPAGWSIPSEPSSSKRKLTLDDDSDTESPEKTSHAANIVAAWAAGASSDEEPDDLRVRASALSILASAVQSNIIGLGSAIISSAVDLALATLTLESAPESAILRRASTILLLDILKALDTARENRHGKDIGFGFTLADDSFQASSNRQNPSSIGSIPSILRKLGFVESIELDDIVRGNLRSLIESLEVWLEKSIMWGIGQGNEAGEPRMELGDRIAGLSVDPLAGRGSTRPRIEEIE